VTTCDEDADEFGPEKAVLRLMMQTNSTTTRRTRRTAGPAGARASARVVPVRRQLYRRWLPDVFASQGRGMGNARLTIAPFRPARGKPDRLKYATVGAAHATPPPDDAPKNANGDPDVVFSPGGALRRARTAGVSQSTPYSAASLPSLRGHSAAKQRLSIPTWLMGAAFARW
jgi:hypothetical protein